MPQCLSIAEDDRRYLAQELHDRTVQTLLQMNIQVSICQQYLQTNNIDALSAELALLEQQSVSASRQIRELITELLPPFTEDTSFKTWLLAEIDEHRQPGGAPVARIMPDEAILLSPEQQLATARIVQEILRNIRKHSQADTVELTVGFSPDRFQLTVIDDGKGFDDRALTTAISENGSAGIATMRLRAEAIGAKLTIKSRPDHGTFVQLTVPL